MRYCDMKKVFGTLAFLSFFYMLGTVGAMEQDNISLGIGAIRAFIGLGCFGVFCKLAGAFNLNEKESRPRSSSPKGGKRKSSI